MIAKEEQRYGRNKTTVISHGFIESGEYRRRFDEVSKDKEINKLLYVLAKIRKIIEKNKGLLTIHSHPNSFPPSLDDFNSACANGYGAGVVCGHNGDVFVYQSYEIIPEESYYYLMNSFRKDGYNAYDAQLRTLEELSKRYDIVCRKVGV